MRNIFCVMYAIMNVIPDDFEKKEYIKLALKDNLQSFLYSSPELFSMWWGMCSEILSENIGRPKNGEWSQIVSDIMKNEIKVDQDSETYKKSIEYFQI